MSYLIIYSKINYYICRHDTFICHISRIHNVVGRHYKIYLLATSHTYDFHVVSCIGRLRSPRQMVSCIPTWFSGFLTEGSRSITHVCADIRTPEMHKFNISTYFYHSFIYNVILNLAMHS